MRSIPLKDALDIARTMFVEAYEGPKEGWSWFTNVKPDSGIFGVIDPLTHQEASCAVVTGGRSIAAHVEHLRWSLANVLDALRGKPWQPDWSASWSVQKVNDHEWRQLRADLRGEFDRVLESIDAREDWSDRMTLTGVFALAPHAAHHLGTIRQTLRTLRDSADHPIATR